MIKLDRRRGSVVIDVGGGNGDLSYLINNLLDIKAIIDPRISDRNIDGISDWKIFSRISCNIEDIDLENIKYDLYVICKHLCGTNIDSTIKKILLSKNVKGFILLPCCYQRGNIEGFVESGIFDTEFFSYIRKFPAWKDNQKNSTKILE